MICGRKFCHDSPDNTSDNYARTPVKLKHVMLHSVWLRLIIHQCACRQFRIRVLRELCDDRVRAPSTLVILKSFANVCPHFCIRPKEWFLFLPRTKSFFMHEKAIIMHSSNGHTLSRSRKIFLNAMHERQRISTSLRHLIISNWKLKIKFDYYFFMPFHKSFTFFGLHLIGRIISRENNIGYRTDVHLCIK